MSKFIEPISSYTRQYIKENAYCINSLEACYKRPITISERGYKILVNSGVRTGVLDINSIKRPTDLMDFIVDVVRHNEKIAKQGLGSGIYA